MEYRKFGHQIIARIDKGEETLRIFFHKELSKHRDTDNSSDYLTTLSFFEVIVLINK